ncbi:MAG: carbon starvation protein A [Ignavibacteriales bacterium]|nr:carbon starvation protein A [Ignavibacteriales bacterium]
MDALLLMIVTFFGYIIMYRIYKNFIAKKIFKLTNKNIAPSVQFEDGIDFVPTKKEIIFGHHFTSIAGTGPIVGPAIAIIWGWVPAVIWVFFGSVLIGAIHDFGSLIISMRNQGKSISDFTSKYINSRAKTFFFLIVFLALWVVISIFGLVIAIIFSMYPTSVIPVWLQIPISIYLGYLFYKKGKSITTWSIIAVITMYLTIVIGYYIPIEMPTIFSIPPTGSWTIVLLIYAFFASVLPVTILLQPRDYINAYQLVIAMTLLVLGVIASALWGNLEIVAPTVQLNPAEAPPMWPFLFITIACGAISGFHCLVSSGTSSKQVKCENDSVFVSVGSMFTEGALATLVIIAVSAGIGLGFTDKSGTTIAGVSAWSTLYSSWTAMSGLTSNIAAFVDGAANLIQNIGIPKGIAVGIMGVFVASFAGTTLDTATRIQRYVFTEIMLDYKITVFKNRYASTGAVVISALVLAFLSGADGKGALSLWPLFGAINQTLAALALIVITMYLKRQGNWKWIISGIPGLFMIVMTLWATILNQISFSNEHNLLLQIINVVIILLVGLIVIEGLIAFFKSPNEEFQSISADN